MPTKILTTNNLPTMINRLDERYIPGSMFYANVPIGTLISFAGNGQLPDGFLVCDGSAVSRTDYADLYDVIGTTYGTGDGSTTFNLPDYRGKFIEGAVTAGTVKSAGLPNITGTFAAGKTLGFADNSNQTGAFYQTETGREGYVDGSTAYQGADTGFDASRSSSVYSDSVNTVQPASVTARVLIKALKSSVPDGAPVNFGQIFGNYIGFMLRQPDTAYAVGSVVYTENLGAAMYLECTVAGTSGSTDLTVSSASEGDTLTDGTVMWVIKKISSIDGVIAEIADTINTKGISHNGIYRGKNLGTFSTVVQIEEFLTAHEVSAGKFTDLYIGDYLTLNDGTYNKVWAIVAFDHYLHKGDTEFTNHHIVLWPKENLTTSYMNSSNTNSGGYPGSYMYSTTIPAVNTNMAKVLGAHLLEHRVLLVTVSNSWAWYSVKACLAGEVEVYGSQVWGTPYDTGTGCKKLPFFDYEGISDNREHWWLKDMYSSTNFCYADDNGNAGNGDASSANGVRPLICVG